MKLAETYLSIIESRNITAEREPTHAKNHVTLNNVKADVLIFKASEVVGSSIEYERKSKTVNSHLLDEC